ncbi:MAG TPA: hydantoinase/oxoprolinase family protein [Streptosporangiaceae bacterium]|jgi:N-methylhydantoinase A
MTAAGHLRVGIDTGGTFTDVVAFDETTGELTVTKTPTVPADPSASFLTGLVKVLGLVGAGGDTLASVSHGTTIATNQLLEGDIGSLGFITTEGFEFILEIARQSVPDGYGNSYFWVKPDRIVPADLVKTVGGRLDHTGAELAPFDEEQAVAAARGFRARGVAAIGVCFLHAYANPAHEQRMAAVLAREYPAAEVSVSSQVVREYREYERSVTTLIDAAVKPRVSRYLRSLTDRLAGLTDRPVPLHVMKSNGGVLTAAEVARQPVTTLLSGPAAGALGAAMIARNAGVSKVLTCDGGGTSTDVAVVVDGEPHLTTEGRVGAYASMMPMVDVVTVGAGGGSIAWVSPEGALKAGPRSAGADPGPLCYGKGGTEVTVTDAHLVLGRIPPHLLGGEVPLDAAAARAGLAALAGRLGLSDTGCATGILEVSAWNQANAVRQITVKRGLDVRDFTLVTFGGSGSLLLCPLIEILGIPAALVPPNPGNVSAFGLLTVDIRNDYVRTAVRKHADLDPALVEKIYAELAEEAAGVLAGQGFAAGRQRLARAADLRYFGQAFEVAVPVADSPFDAALAQRVAAAFHDAHQARYGYDFRDNPRQQVEWVNLRVTGIGPLRRPRLAELAAGDGDPARATTGRRPVCFERSGEYLDTPVYWRESLAAGDVVTGPAVIEEYGATVPVHPGFAATVDRFANLLVSKASPP